jgi:homoserine acetyltransferase
MSRTRRPMGVATALVTCAWISHAAAEVHEIEGFTFESGATLEAMRVGYDTHGTLNQARDNAILITHGTSSNRSCYDDYIGCQPEGLAEHRELSAMIAGFLGEQAALAGN